VNAVGPYAYDPTPIVRACLAVRAAYLDLAEDPTFTAALYRAVAAEADDADAVFVAGCSTVPGLVEVLAQAFAPLAGLAGVDAWLSLGSANPPSTGLLAGLVRPLGRPAPDGERWFGRVVAHEVAGRRLAFGRYPSGLPRERLRVGARELPLRFHAGFDRVLLTRALQLAAPALARLRGSSATGLARALAPVARVAGLAGTPRGALQVEALDTGGRRLGSVEVVAERDGLDVPAAPPLWAARALRASSATGVLRLADLVSPHDAVAGLRELGCEVRDDLPSPP
jgi:hypothetical protein